MGVFVYDFYPFVQICAHLWQISHSHPWIKIIYKSTHDIAYIYLFINIIVYCLLSFNTEDIVVIRPDCAFKKIRGYDDWEITRCPHQEGLTNQSSLTAYLAYACETDNYNAVNYRT